MKIKNFTNEAIELGDHTADEPHWYIVRDADNKVCAGPFEYEFDANRACGRYQWFSSRTHFVGYGVDDDNNFVDNQGDKEDRMFEGHFEMPEKGDNIRTNGDMEGKVEGVVENAVIFRLADGRLMRTGLNNVTVVEKLIDQDDEIMEDELNEISNDVLAKYKTASAAQAGEADLKGDTKHANKRFSGIVKATKKQFANDKKDADKKTTTEGSMGGINRSRPAVDVSYDEVLNDVMDKWKGQTANAH